MSLVLESGFWGSNVPTLGVSNYEGFHIVVDDGDMGMPKTNGPFRVGIYKSYKDYEGEEAIYTFEGDSFSLNNSVERIVAVVKALKTIERLITLLGNGFHPESFISDYVDRNDKQFFKDDECETLQKELDKANEVLGDEVFHVSNKFFQ